MIEEGQLQGLPPLEMVERFATTYAQEKQGRDVTYPQSMKSSIGQAPAIAEALGIDFTVELPRDAIYPFWNSFDLLLANIGFCAIAHFHARIEDFCLQENPTDLPEKFLPPLISSALGYIDVCLAGENTSKTSAEIRGAMSQPLAPDQDAVHFWVALAKRTHEFLYGLTTEYTFHSYQKAILMRGNAEQRLIDRWLKEMWDKCEFDVGEKAGFKDQSSGLAFSAGVEFPVTWIGKAAPKKTTLRFSPSVLERISEGLSEGIAIAELDGVASAQYELAKWRKENLPGDATKRALWQRQIDWHEALVKRVIKTGAVLLNLDPEQTDFITFQKVNVAFRFGGRDKGLKGFNPMAALITRAFRNKGNEKA